MIHAEHAKQTEQNKSNIALGESEAQLPKGFGNVQLPIDEDANQLERNKSTYTLGGDEPPKQPNNNLSCL